MTTPHLISLAARFPLVPRSRPPARPLETRATRLARLAGTAYQERDSDKASTAFNGAALLASDCGAADLAASWCRWHATLYLNRARLDPTGARFALEPLVNLARLRTRAGDGDGAYHLLIELHHAVTHQTATTIDGVELDTDRWDNEVARHPELTDWLRRVLLTDGARALVAAGRWNDAVDHTRRHGGLTSQLLDGRQVAILANLIAGDAATASRMLHASVIAEPWEHPIKEVLLAMCAAPHQLSEDQRRSQLTHPAQPQLAPGNGLAVYRTRLGLTILDLTGPGLSSERQHISERLCSDALSDEDGHAVNDLVGHPLVTPARQADLQTFLGRCGLHCGELPASVHTDLQRALTSAAVAIQARP